ncbi:MAG: hypothetical protein H7X97_14215 [Opitutaceae bacterium]|nr:hypothetical protein [Verrucomicrobiales bacterium]
MNNATESSGFQAGRTNGSRADQAGFSLSEFMGVMAVVALLFTMSAPNFLKSPKPSQANAFTKNDHAQVQSYVLKLADDSGALSDNAASGSLTGMASHSKRAFSWMPVAPSDEPWNLDSEQIPAKAGTMTGGFSSPPAGARPFRQGWDELSDPSFGDRRSRSGGFVSLPTK